MNNLPDFRLFEDPDFVDQVPQVPDCHIADMTEDERQYYNDMCFSPCDSVRDCLECRFFH